jgi:hypothetical protein
MIFGIDRVIVSVLADQRAKVPNLARQLNGRDDESVVLHIGKYLVALVGVERQAPEARRCCGDLTAIWNRTLDGTISKRFKRHGQHHRMM